jgi:hypothetical protein
MKATVRAMAALCKQVGLWLVAGLGSAWVQSFSATALGGSCCSWRPVSRLALIAKVRSRVVLDPMWAQSTACSPVQLERSFTRLQPVLHTWRQPAREQNGRQLPAQVCPPRTYLPAVTVSVALDGGRSQSVGVRRSRA